ncbi:MAG: hypothetical protein GF310_05445 [candidate division Zixibacteria bacterium]|nr:hypothetical protein [candidate division Zixibacteria bacterium]
MFRTIEDFESIWKIESENTINVMKSLTQESLSQSVADGHRDIGRIAWHNILTIPEMISHTGLEFKGIKEDDPMPDGLEKIIDAYKDASEQLMSEIKSKWSDEDLLKEDDMYGLKWKKGFTLYILVVHQAHHRGQMTILMRQAGLKVPGVCGPSKEEWANFGGEAPEI